jgi:dienelactone hydrolase
MINFFSKQENLELEQHRDKIVKIVLNNLGFSSYESLNDAQKEMFNNELKRPDFIRHYSNFPCLIDPNNENFEEVNDEEAYEICAKNLFKHLTFGQATNTVEHQALSESPLYHPIVIEHFYKKRDPKFANEIRRQLQLIFNRAWENLQFGQMQFIFNRAWENLQFGQNSIDFSKQYEIFQNQLISSFPFWDPVDGEMISMPQKIGREWQNVEYTFKKIDISPKTGMLASVIRDEDRMYSYVLETKHRDAQNHLLLMGTTYPSGQGELLAGLENFKPNHSIGEGHDLTGVYEWLESQERKKVNVTGHSKGATMAMLVAAEHPDKIEYASALNPAGFHKKTLERLRDGWNQLPTYEKPVIEVFAQEGDPVFAIGSGFLPQTRITKVISSHQEAALNFKLFGMSLIPESIRKAYESHIHIYSGRENVTLVNVNVEQENQSFSRKYFSFMKEDVYDHLKYSQMTLSLFCELKYRNFQQDHFTIPAPIDFIVTTIAKLIKSIMSVIVLSLTITLGHLYFAGQLLIDSIKPEPTFANNQGV